MSDIKTVSILAIVLFSATAWGKSAPQREPTSKIQREVRLNHAQELLGKYYSKSTVKNGEKVRKINGLIYKWAREHLPFDQRHHYQRIAQTIIDESLKHQMDPVFLLSVIQGESGFDPVRLGSLDEIGLMQIRPSTAEWFTKREGMKYTGAQSLFDPVVNIRIGAAYLAYLRDKFDSHAQLYLAAYNMGARNVDNALSQNIWPKDYPSHVMKFYVEFYSQVDTKGKAQGKSAVNDRKRDNRG